MNDSALPLPGLEPLPPATRKRRPRQSSAGTRTGRDVTFNTPTPGSDLDIDVTAWLSGSVDVVVDDAPSRLGALSYRVPSGMQVRIGDAVEVPFGRRTMYGVIIGAGDDTAATRDLTATFGLRTHPSEIAAAHKLAAQHFVPTAALIARLAPRSGKGAVPLDAGPVELKGDCTGIVVSGASDAARRFVARAPGVSSSRLAAEMAVELLASHDATAAPEHVGSGQVLICCGSAADAKATLAEFSSGAARVDAGASSAGAWSGFAAGSVRIAVGTRASAWFSPRRLAGIVVSEEQHPGHIESRQPHTHTRDVAFARLEGRDVPLVFTGLCASSSALANGVKLCTAGTAADWPAMNIVDRSSRDPGSRAFPTEVKLAVAKATRAGRTAVFVADRKTARRTCAGCRAALACSDCTERHCDHVLSPCARCGSRDVRLVGWDAERIVDAFNGSVRAVSWSELPKVRDAGLVIVFDADAPGRIPHLEPERRAATQLLAAAEAAGRDGQVLFVTADPTDPVLCAVVSRNARTVSKLVWANAKELGLPPFGRVVLARVARDKTPPTSTLPGHVVGPRSLGPGEWEVLVRCTDSELPAVGAALDRLRRSAKVRVTVS